MIVDIKDLSVAFGGNEILNSINLKIEDKDRIGLIGANGAGKSTLLNVICKNITEYEGEINFGGKRIGYLKQNPEIDGEAEIDSYLKSVFSGLLKKGQELNELYALISVTPQESDDYSILSSRYSSLQTEFEQKDGYNIDVKINMIKNGMGFSDIDGKRLIKTLSGGEKTRLNLAYLLLSEPDLLILDEPTNHLDFRTLNWLEAYLSEYKGAVLMVSHDRYFLDKCVNEIAEIINGRLKRYKGNYTAFKALKKQIVQNEEKEYKKQQEEIAALKEYIAKNGVRASTAKSAKSRQNTLDRMEILEKPSDYTKTIKLDFDYDIEPVKDVITIKNLTLKAGEKLLFENVNLDVKRGEKIAVVGENGIGKSTLLKEIIARNPSVNFGMNCKISYFEQESTGLSPEKTVFSEIHDRFPSMYRQEIQNVLGRMLISSEDVYKRIGMLSGGEKAKVKFAVMMLMHGNVLIMDEPTNHLDLPSKEELDEALKRYAGTILMVSHDRYLLNRVPDKIIEFSHGGLKIYKGNYDYYIKEKENEAKSAEKVVEAKEEKKTQNDFYRSKKNRAAAAKKANDLKKLEQEIEETENRIKNTENEMALPEVSGNFEILTEKCAYLEECRNKLNLLYEKWEELCSD